MRSKTLMLAGAGALAMGGGAVAAPAAMADPIPQAASYADLLEPVPDALARIHADDQVGYGDAHLVPAQLNVGIAIGHHHHHHHHHHSARWFRSHGFWWNGQVWVRGPRPHHHHHHHHHHYQNYR